MIELLNGKFRVCVEPAHSPLGLRLLGVAAVSAVYTP